LKWVINDMQFKTEYRNNDGSRYYAQIDITFFEWMPTELVLTKTSKSATQLLASSSAASSSGSSATKLTSTPTVSSTGIGVTSPSPITLHIPLSSSVYIVRKNDTLETIAKVCLGNANQWSEIALLNTTNGQPIRDPKSIKVGQRLRMPLGAKIPAPPAPSPPVSLGTGNT
jgi:nucleoid-associated protein YgaU